MNIGLDRMAHNKTLLRVELIGAVFMIALGSLLHFVFDWFGGWTPLALIAAVNESIWEHLKLAFWPGVLWATIMPLRTGLCRLDVFSAKGVSLLVSAVLIVLIFTSYTAILGENRLLLDIGTFVLAILAGQLFSAWLLVLDTDWRRRLFLPGLVLLALQLVTYSLFTYFPPDHWLFVEARSGLRGIF
ncbi:DUF6512 family protein [Marimonas arenosa]|uniref:DUF6512 family protein n=2 Tax=Marimonas arenosa TaxID=1795305 RepID=A0AAE3WEX1_9RHOB|nr:DUF6512 family protein [Marimonas arenosa]